MLKRQLCAIRSHFYHYSMHGSTDLIALSHTFQIIVLTGMTWTLFLAANLLDIVAIWYISVVANSLQGTLIGMIFLWNEHVRSLWRQKLFGRGGQSSQES